MKKFVNGWLDTGLLWFSAVLIPVWLMVIFKTAMSEPDVVYCMSDIYGYAHEKGLIIFLLLSQLFIINHIKYEMRAAVLVRKKSMKSFWISLCKKIFLQAGLFVLYVFVLVTAYGVTHFQWKCNWRELNSNAYAQMQRPVEFEVADGRHFSDCAVCGNYRYGNDDCPALVEAVPAGLRLCGNDGAVYTGKADDTGTGQYLFPAHVFSLHKALLSGDSCGR